MKDFTLLKMEGELVGIMCDVCSDYKKVICYENGKKVLYLELLKALYGCVQSALLWYELFYSTLQGMGFELNPYGACVAKKVGGKQCTIVWHVDDTKISHEDSKAVSHVIQKREARFGEMAVTRGKEHVFLGMNISFHKDNTTSIVMNQGGHCPFWRGHHSRSATTPTKRNLFEIKENSVPLTDADREIFHSVVAKLLYVSKCGRLDIQLPIAFPCTRVSCSTEQDWSKLKRTLEYLRGTLDDI
jgi:hypothetical protein